MNKQNKAIVRDAGNGEVELTATQPAQLPDLQAGLIRWVERRLVLANREFQDARDAVEAARGRFDVNPLERLAQLAERRRDYYAKASIALGAGYVLMPTLDAELFAVRTDRKSPPKKLYTFFASKVPDIAARELPAGEGRYVDNDPVVKETEVEHERSTGKPGETVTEMVQAFAASALDEEIVFPIVMAKPEIIEATTRAMALRVFDEMGLLPARAGRGDPVIVGRILRPGTSGNRWAVRRTSFLIAWHVDTRDI